MSHLAKLFTNGYSQAVRLPAAYRFTTKEVYICKNEETGGVILSPKPESWDNFFALLKGLDNPKDFLSAEERQQNRHDRDPYEYNRPLSR